MNLLNNKIHSVDPIVKHYVDEYRRTEKQRSGYNVPWLQALRRQSLEKFSSCGFPAQGHEGWQYTNLAQLVRHRFTLADPESRLEISNDIPASILAKGIDSHRLVFVDGCFYRELSHVEERLLDTLIIDSLASVIEKEPHLLEKVLSRQPKNAEDNFYLFNTSFIHDGAYIYLPPSTRLSKPLELLFISTARHFNPLKNLIIADAYSEAVIVENYCSLGEEDHHFTQAATELYLDSNARVEHYKFLQENSKAFHISLLNAVQERRSCLHSNTLTLGGFLVRGDIAVNLADSFSSCLLNGLYLVNGRQHVDHHTLISHEKSDSVSGELFKGVISDRGRAVFDGKIVVQPEGYQSTAKQTNNNLLLSPHAEVDTKPQLEIYADDVVCHHGATVGQLSEEALFYLCSRGIDASEAYNALIYGFIFEIIKRMPLIFETREFRDYLKEYVCSKYKIV